jgi:hypothetical protein
MAADPPFITDTVIYWGRLERIVFPLSFFSLTIQTKNVDCLQSFQKRLL